ncbi:MAG: hypothetical protein ABJ263_14460 [Tateyamaria sp.]|uniref:hypothetical protein n=1 Tax=Tateyamaria sp. TaxID=1929288 RepID=UPI0032834F83
MTTLSVAVSDATHHDLADMTAFIVAECEMCTQDTEGNMIDINPDEVIVALKAWAQMHRREAQKGGLR